MTLELLVTALGLALVLEGLVPALFPNKWRNYVSKLAAENPSNIRSMGLVVVSIGAFILFVS